MTATVSVVVPVRNGASTIGQTLHGLLAQARLPQRPEIIVVDNGSNDATREIVRGFDVTLLEEATPGAAAARNCGTRNAGGEIIAYLDADTLPTRHWLSELVATFRDARLMLVGGKTMSFQPRTPIARFIARSPVHDPRAHIEREHMPFVPSLNMAVRRRAVDAIGGWSEDMMTAEDMDFCYRLLQRFPGSMKYEPGALLFHHERETEDALKQQAWGYGEGSAQMHLRHPETVDWGPGLAGRVAWRLAQRALAPPVARLARLCGLTSRGDVEFFYYHRLWNWWYWRGYLSMYRNKQRRPL